MRADARKNYDLLLNVAREVISEQGADASLRDIARKAEVGLGTLYRHFPTREALLEALLRDSFDAMTAKAAALIDGATIDGNKARSAEPGDPAAALITWFRDMVMLAHKLRGVTSTMMAAIEAPDSALHASCVAMKGAGAELLSRAQAAGKARRDMDGADLFALVGALAWVGDQPALAPRADRLFEIMASAVLVDSAGSVA